MKLSHAWVPIFLLAAALCGCGAGPATQEAADRVGVLQLSLVGTDSARQQYRLRNASFEINGYSEFGPAGGGGSNTQETVSSETDLDRPFIERRVLPGTYWITLSNSDWYLERLSGPMPERIAKAVLLSSATQYTYVYDRSVTPVDFRFGVDGDLIDFRHGDLRICISIERPDDSATAGRPSQSVGGSGGSPDSCYSYAGSGAGTGGTAGGRPFGAFGGGIP